MCSSRFGFQADLREPDIELVLLYHSVRKKRVVVLVLLRLASSSLAMAMNDDLHDLSCLDCICIGGTTTLSSMRRKEWKIRLPTRIFRGR